MGAVGSGTALDDFELIEEIGRGATGILYKAHQRSLHRVVALKVLHSEIAENAYVIQRFRAEAVLAANLNHPNIVPVYAVDPSDPPRFFSMALIEGRSLGEKVGHEGPVLPAKTIEIAVQICDALSHAHKRNIIHRDIKPGNILLEGPEERVRITDFGIARDLSGELVQRTRIPGFRSGTPAFMSPEQNLGQMLDQRADIYSAGMTLYYMLTGGHVAYRAPNSAALAIAFRDQTPLPPSHYVSGVSRELDQIVLSMIAVDSQHRPSSFDAVARELSELSGEGEARGPTSRAVEPAERGRKDARRVTGRRILAALLVLIAAGTAAWLAPMLWESEPTDVPAMRVDAEEARDKAQRMLAEQGLARDVELKKVTAFIDAGNRYATAGKSTSAREMYTQARDLANSLCQLCDASASRRHATLVWGAASEYGGPLAGRSDADKAKSEAEEAFEAGDYAAAADKWLQATNALANILLRTVDRRFQDGEGETPRQEKERMLSVVYQVQRAAPMDTMARRVGKDIASSLIITSPTTNMKFTYVPPGEFRMGSDRGDPDELPVHTRTVTKGFYLGTHEVTRAQFEAFVNEEQYITTVETGGVLFVRRAKGDEWPTKWPQLPKGTNPLDKTRHYSWREPNFVQTKEHPVVGVSHEDAIRFCQWLSAKENPTRYRLPSEEEWEYACRAGTETVFSMGDALNDSSANFWGSEPLMATTPVGQFPPNRWGIHDMHGNVWEWCEDLYDTYAPDDEAPTHHPVEYVRRGGGWASSPRNCRSANRWKLPNEHTKTDSGFRVVREDPNGP